MSGCTSNLSAQSLSTNNQNSHAGNFFSSLKILEHSTATPITTILINLELLSQDNTFTQTKSNCGHYLNRALLSAKYLKKVMKQCSQPIQSHTFQVKSALNEVVNICQRPAKQGQLISFIKIADNLSLTGSQLYFQEAVICLLNNAFQAYQQHAANKLVVLHCQTNQKQLEIKVTDGGQGFLCLQDQGSQPASIEKVPQKGTGLAFVESVIQNHFQGKMNVITYPSRGSTIHCLLPISK